MVDRKFTTNYFGHKLDTFQRKDSKIIWLHYFLVYSIIVNWLFLDWLEQKQNMWYSENKAEEGDQHFFTGFIVTTK